jgi:hypothetical protein
MLISESKLKDSVMYRHLGLAVWLWAAGICVAGAANDFDRYNVVLERMPFGEPEAAPGSAGQPVPEAVSFAKDLKMCAITDSDGAIAVGFVNIALNPPKAYYMHVGDPAEDGLEVVKADYEAQRALLRKGAEEKWISMNPEGVGAPVLGPTPVAMGPAPLPSQVATNRNSVEDRLRRRREAMRLRQADAPKLTGQELEKALQEYQMNLIRSGGEQGPALPVPLTKEMDDQLVKEGMLPPADEAQPSAQ